MSLRIGPHTSAPGVRRRALGFEMWAEDGDVWLEHKQSGETHVLTQAKAKDRADSFAAECDSVWDKARDSGNSTDKAYAREKYHALKGLVEAMYETLRDAAYQGDSNNPTVRRQKLQQFLREKMAGSGRSYMKELLPAVGVAPAKPFKLITTDLR
jgi:hypothetical protein